MPGMNTQSKCSSFTSVGTLQADSCQTNFEGEAIQVTEDEAKQATALARSVLVRVQLPSPTADVEDAHKKDSSPTGSPSWPANGVDLTTSKRASTNLTIFPAHTVLPTPEATPTKSMKRSHIEAFDYHDAVVTPTKTQKTTVSAAIPAQDTPSTSPSTLTRTRRPLFHNTPKWSAAYKGTIITGSTTPQRTHLPSPPVPISPRSPTPLPPHIQKLQDELAEPLLSDVIPSPTATSPYGFRKVGRQPFTSAEIVDQDESGTYDPNVEEWEEEEEEDEEEQEVDEANDEVDDEIQITGVFEKCPKGVQLSSIEYERFLASLLKQVSFTRVDHDIASNRGQRVWRRVLKEMFREKIGEGL